MRESDHAGLDILPADFDYAHLQRWLGEREDPAAALRAALAELGRRYERG